MMKMMHQRMMLPSPSVSPPASACIIATHHQRHRQWSSSCRVIRPLSTQSSFGSGIQSTSSSP